MDEDQPLDPETEREMRETMGQAQASVREEGMHQMARYIRRNYLVFRGQGFSRRQSFTLISVLYQNLLMQGAVS